MEATPLWKFLQGLCHDFHWDYGVFWKLQPDEKLLKWEEGYCHHTTLRGSMESEPVDMVFNIADPIFASTWGSSLHDGCSYEFPVGASLDDMASVQYHLGKGIVGTVAYTGNHSWILSEDLLTCDFESNMVPECPDEWLLQFATGIKTIVLISVAQHGVLQLGSSKKVDEDPALVALVRDKFNAYLNNLDVVTTSSVESQTKASSSTIWRMRPEDLEVVFSIKQASDDTSTTNQMMPVYHDEDTCYISGENRLDNSCNIRGADAGFRYAGLDRIVPLYHDTVPEMLDITMIGSSIMAEDMKSFSYSDYNFDIFGGDSSVEGKLVEPFVDESTDTMTNMNSFFSFPMDCELHKALGSTFRSPSHEHLWNSAVASEGDQSSSSDLINRNLLQGNKPLSLERNEFLLKRDDEEHLIKPVYATTDSYINNDLSKELNEAKSSIESLGRLSPSTKEFSVVKKVAVCRSSETINGPNTVFIRPPLPSLTDDILSTLNNEKKLKKGYNNPQTKGSKICRKKAGPGENLKARPRDRQLIQDRVKVLRELVPRGSKCSIDGLLDRTISHMLFLRGVSERAGKLRHWVNQEVTGLKKMRLSSPKPDSKNGTSWAFELGSDSTVCPIVVKDLEHPGHMLIEMLCNHTGLFLEIAEVIRRMDLTILKGSTESHTDNTWAHFIVEVSKGFQRLDIFWPLMQLLQKMQTPVSDQI